MGKRWAFTSVLMLLAPFQNCGQFRSADVLAQASLAQCRTGYRSEALRLQSIQPANLACAEPTAYACERRVFTPEIVADQTQERHECPNGDAFCVDVTTRSFTTASARSTDNDAQFATGADYNHVETRCYHRWTYRGQIVIEHDDDTLSDALANARQSCLNAQGVLR